MTDAELRIEFAARADAWHRYLQELLTGPLTVRELCEWFDDTSRKKMALILKHIDGAVKLDRSTWRVPVRAMPPAFQIHCGFVQSENLGPIQADSGQSLLCES